MNIRSRVVPIASALALSAVLLVGPDSSAQEKKDAMGKDGMTTKGDMSKGETKKDAMGKDSMKKDDMMMKKKDEMKK